VKQIRIGSVSIPLDSYVVGGTALLGIRESGKTYAAKGIAEQLLDYKIPIVVFDAIGVWRHLKVARPSAGGRGFKIVIAGGESADLPLTPASAPAIVRAAIAENIPLVIDLYDPKLSKADWRRIVQHCFRTLLYENKGLRHIFLEETAEYAPQKVIDGETYAEVEKLVRMGGNKSLGITLINQRAQEVNKAVLDLCENLVLMRQRGAHAIEALEKWIDKLEPDIAKTIAAEMPRMEQGDAWVFSGSAEAAKRTHTAHILSYHPDRRKPQTKVTAPERMADTADFVSKLAGELKTLTEAAAANDPVALKRRIAELERRPATVQYQASPINTDAMQKEAYQDGYKVGWNDCRQEADTIRVELIGGLHAAIDKAGDLRIALEKQPPQPRNGIMRAPVVPRHGTGIVTRVKAPAGANGGDRIPEGEAKILAALIQYPAGLGRDQITVIAGYKKSTRDAYIARLRDRGYVAVAADGIQVTEDGRDAMPDAQPLPTGDELQAFWMNRLPEGEAKVLAVLIGAYPDAVTRDVVTDRAGYKKSTRDAYLARLSAKELVDSPAPGEVRAAAALFS